MTGKEFCIKNLGKIVDNNRDPDFNGGMVVGYQEEKTIVIVSYTTEIGWIGKHYSRYDKFLIDSPLCVSYWLFKVDELIVKE